MVLESLATVWIDDPAHPADQGTSLDLQRAWPQAAGHLLLEYRSPAGDLYPGQWHRDPLFLADQASTLNQAHPNGALWGRNGSGDRVLLQPHGLDGRMTTLAARLRIPGNSLVSHRPGKRAVVRCSTGSGLSYRKFFASGKSFRRACQAVALLDGLGLRFATPEVLATDPQDRSLCFSALAGQSLHQLCRQDVADPAQAHQLGRALADLHAPDRVGHGAPLVAHSESSVLHSWLEKLVSFFPDLARQMAPMIQQQMTRDSLFPASQPAIIHRDFHDKQIFHTEQGVGIIDFDTLALGDPTIDLANLLVHLELRCLQGRTTAAFVNTYGQNVLESYATTIDPGRLLHCLDSIRLRLVCVYAFRRPWQSLLTPLRARVGRPFADGLDAPSPG
ncbi:MAG: aminoglycoside phosphotransferase family protein [Cyanobacteriota bacterium]|nr:aminoglycoside phosphotransferase family protein [Cyanobacteriota bacterium]